jgi:hypothetical protein
MAQSGYTPIKLYSSGTTTNVPLAADLAYGELAINYADGKLFYKNSGGTVSQFSVSIGGSTTQVIYNNSGAYAGSANLTFDGTKLSTNTQGIANYADYAAISAPSYQEGRVFYDTAKKALAYYNDVSTALVHMGLDTQFKVINNTGSSIPNGSAVYVTGTSSGQTYPNIALARADVASTSSVIGLTEGAIANGAVGYVVSNGTIEGVNTSSYTVGQVLYLSPYSAGQLMNTVPPTGLVVQVGVATYVNASGNIYVRQTQPTNLATTQGGTGLTSYTAGDTLYYSTGTSLTKLAIGTAYQIKAVNAGGTAPSWQGLSSLIDNGLSASTQGSLLYRDASAWVPLTPGTNGQVLTSGGAGANPSWAAASSGVSTITFGSTGLTPSTATSGAVSVAGTLATTNGGTNLTSFTSGGALYATSTSALTTGTLPTASGGTNLTTFTSGGAMYATSTSALATGTLPNTAGGTGQSSAFTQYGVTYANATTTLATTAAGTSTQVLHGNASGAPTFSAVSLANDITGTLGAANGGTGVANNAASTLTISGNFASTFVVAGANSYTLPNASDTLVNLGSTQTLTAKTLTNPTVTNYVESVVAIGNSSTSQTLSLTNGTVQTVTMTGNCTFTMPTATAGKSFILIISTGAGGFTGTFTSVKWPAGTAPTLTSTASRWDIASFVADGTNWYGNIAQAYS